jgi:hypothetical protein
VSLGIFFIDGHACQLSAAQPSASEPGRAAEGFAGLRPRRVTINKLVLNRREASAPCGECTGMGTPELPIERGFTSRFDRVDAVRHH